MRQYLNALGIDFVELGRICVQQASITFLVHEQKWTVDFLELKLNWPHELRANPICRLLACSEMKSLVKSCPVILTSVMASLTENKMLSKN